MWLVFILFKQNKFTVLPRKNKMESGRGLFLMQILKHFYKF